MVNIEDFDKDQLSEYAKTVFNVDLDLTRRLDFLKKDVQKLQDKPKAESVTVPVNPKATHILNRDTGAWYIWTNLLAAHLKNAVPCDEDGNPV